MKTILRLFSVLVSSVWLTSCFQHEITIHLKKDGSGTLVEETRFGAQMIQMMEQMAAGFGGDAKDADPFKDLMSEEKAKERAAKLGQGIRFEKAEKVEANGAKGARVTYHFDDINKVQLTTTEGMNQTKMAGAPGAPGAEQAKPDKPIRFAYAGDTLTISMPEPEAADKEAAAKAEKPDVENMGAAELQQVKMMFGDMRMSISLHAETGIASTDATHREGDTVTLMDMNFGKLIENADNLKKLAALDQENPAAAMEALKGIDGVKFETKPSIKIELK